MKPTEKEKQRTMRRLELYLKKIQEVLGKKEEGK